MKKSYLIYLICVIISALALNGIIVSAAYSSVQYFSEGNVILETGAVKTADAAAEKYSYEDYPKLLDSVREEIGKIKSAQVARELLSGDFSAYLQAGAYTDSDRMQWAEETSEKIGLTDEQIKAKRFALEYSAARIEYALGFDGFSERVRSNAENIISASFISKDSFAYRNAVKTGRDFYSLGNVKLSAAGDMGIRRLFDDRATDLAVTLAAAAAAAVLCLNFKAEPMLIVKKTALSAAPIAVSVLISACYFFNIAASERFFGTGPLSRSVQSSREFLSCAYLLNMGALIGIRILFKIFFILIIFLAAAGVILNGKRLTAAAAAGIFLCQLYMYEFTDLPRSANVFSALSSERIFGVYENINIMGNAVSSVNVFIAFMLLCLTAAWIFYRRQAGRFAEKAVEEKERRYYSEICRRQEEARQLRHDIGNHLRALSALMGSGDYEAAKGYLRELSGEVYGSNIPTLLSRAVPDALIFSKTERAEKEGIRVVLGLSADCGGISDIDLCSIFGNLLDNAIEGMASDIPPEKRIIRLTARRRHSLICIVCENPCNEAGINKNFETTKSDAKYHGFGLRRIENIARKYGGGTEISVKDGKFTVTVLISVS